jgi:hypothetical protein
MRHRMLAEPLRDGGHRRFAGWVPGGLLLERGEDDGAEAGHGCLPAGRIDGDHRDDGVGFVRWRCWQACAMPPVWLAAAA